MERLAGHPTANMHTGWVRVTEVLRRNKGIAAHANRIPPPPSATQMLLGDAKVVCDQLKARALELLHVG